MRAWTMGEAVECDGDHEPRGMQRTQGGDIKKISSLRPLRPLRFEFSSNNLWVS